MKIVNSKMLLLGDGAVGKSSLIQQFVKSEFSRDYKPTIGVDVFSKEVKFTEIAIRLAIWDIAGQQIFKMFRKTFFMGAKGALIVFDYTRPQTFNSLEEWIKDLQELSGNVPFVIIGNKIDLQKQVDINAVKALAAKYGMNFIETSAKDNVNVDEAFTDLSMTLLQREMG